MKSYEKIEKLLTEASEIRATGRTDINEFSSRSHLVLTVHIDSENLEL